MIFSIDNKENMGLSTIISWNLKDPLIDEQKLF